MWEPVAKRPTTRRRRNPRRSPRTPRAIRTLFRLTSQVRTYSPDSLTHEQIVTYLETVESDFVLGSNTDGYVKIGEITTESVAHGYLAQVPVNGGYYNKAKDDNPTETIHYDLGTHTTRYFLGEQIVRRVEAGDPREQGDVIACTSG